nr:GNAT family N-acetyltransferase [Streptomyces sp. NRRL B-1381]
MPPGKHDEVGVDRPGRAVGVGPSSTLNGPAPRAWNGSPSVPDPGVRPSGASTSTPRRPAPPRADRFPGMSVETEVIREATDEVVEAFARLLPQLSSTAQPLDRTAVERLTLASTNTLLVARIEGVIVATLTLVVSPLPSGLRARIEDVVVDSAARGHGVGTVLIDKALELAAHAGARTVDLTSRPSREAANRLYERAGFRRRASTVHRVTLP